MKTSEGLKSGLYSRRDGKVINSGLRGGSLGYLLLYGTGDEYHGTGMMFITLWINSLRYSRFAFQIAFNVVFRFCTLAQPAGLLRFRKVRRSFLCKCAGLFNGCAAQAKSRQGNAPE